MTIGTVLVGLFMLLCCEGIGAVAAWFVGRQAEREGWPYSPGRALTVFGMVSAIMLAACLAASMGA